MSDVYHRQAYMRAYREKRLQAGRRKQGIVKCSSQSAGPEVLQSKV
jgi:hypothetical protein